MQELIRHRFRRGNDHIVRLRRSVELAEQSGDEKDVGYALYFLGWALWLRGDLTEAQCQLERALAMGERIGGRHLLVFSLLALTLTALRQHDAEAVRGLIPRTRTAAGKDGGRHRPHAGGAGLARLAGAASGPTWSRWPPR